MSDAIEDALAKLTLARKIGLCSGGGFWCTENLEEYGIPAAVLSDGPSGVRRQRGAGDSLGLGASVEATCFPAAVTTAATFDPALVERIGRAVGEEALALGVGVVLGPGANIKRLPVCGRNFEYFSEDPLLSGEMAAAWIRGAQGTGAQACLKHLVANNQERRRFSSDSMVDERTLREIYLASFERAVRRGRPAAVMSAYNKLCGTYCSENRWLLKEVLRDEWGFAGAVMTDWGGLNDRTRAFAAGCDLVMPGGSATGEPEAYRAVRAGALDEVAVTASARRVLTLMVRAWDATARARTLSASDLRAHHELACEVACAGAVLMKNENGALPIAPAERVAFIGEMARSPRYQGAGSSHINPGNLVSPVEAAPGVPFMAGCDAKGSVSEEELDRAVALARSVDVPIVFVGLPPACESEGFDRDGLALPEGQNRLVRAVAAANARAVVVLMAGGAVEMPWFDEVAGVLYLGLAGEAVGEACRRLLWGEAEPAGRLAETWPLSAEDCPAMASYRELKRDAHYREGLYVGYRYYETAAVPVRLPFGFGLSYTVFAYRSLSVVTAGDDWRVRVRVANAGQRAGTAAPQLYVEPPTERGYRPAIELRGFRRLELAPGQEGVAEFHLGRRDLSIWYDGAWRVPSGVYTLRVGECVRDTPLSATIEVGGEVPAPSAPTPWYACPDGAATERDFEALLGRSAPERFARKGSFTMENSLAEIRRSSLAAAIAYRVVALFATRSAGGRRDPLDPVRRMQMASSVESTLTCLRVCGRIRGYVLEGLLQCANGHPLRGLRLMLKRPRRLA